MSRIYRFKVPPTHDVGSVLGLIDALASHAGGDDGLDSDLAVDLESARNLLNP
jgi:hypothetical protein